MQCQLDAIAEGLTLFQSGSHRPDGDWMQPRAHVDDVRQSTSAALTARIADVVGQTSRSYPLQRESFLPTLQRVLCVFERSVLVAVIGGVRSGVSTLTWVSGIDAATGLLTLRIRALVRTPPRCSVCFSTEITDPLQIAVPDGDPTFADEVPAIGRRIGSASMCVEQRSAEPASVHAGKHVAKRAATLHVPPTCHVVETRRLDQRRRDTTGAHDAIIDWHCQWLVRGHWRQQLHP